MIYVARDKSGILRLFTVKPSRIVTSNSIWQYENTWCINLTEGYEMCIDSALFSDLKWEDEPLEVELVPKSELIGLKILAGKYREEHSENLYNCD